MPCSHLLMQAARRIPLHKGSERCGTVGKGHRGCSGDTAERLSRAPRKEGRQERWHFGNEKSFLLPLPLGADARCVSPGQGAWRWMCSSKQGAQGLAQRDELIHWGRAGADPRCQSKVPWAAGS